MLVFYFFLYCKMSYTIKNFLINTSHFIPGTNRYRYQLSGSNHIELLSGSEICVSSISMYNYPFNISQAMNNNKLVVSYAGFNIANINARNINGVQAVSNYTDPISNTTININSIIITIPDGYYDVPSFNSFLQNIFLLIGFYLLQTNTDGSSQEEVFITTQTNPTQYKCQFNFYPVPRVLTSGLSNPSNTFSLPVLANTCPQIYFPATNNQYGGIGQIFGFQSGSLGGGGSVSHYLSTTYPQVNPISTIIFTANIVYNDVCVPNNLLCQFPIKGSYGSIISEQFYTNFISALEIKTNYIEISLFDSFLNPIQIIDPEFSMTLLVKSPIIKNTRP